MEAAVEEEHLARSIQHSALSIQHLAFGTRHLVRHRRYSFLPQTQMLSARRQVLNAEC
jgi:hypothetical protein